MSVDKSNPNLSDIQRVSRLQRKNIFMNISETKAERGIICAGKNCWYCWSVEDIKKSTNRWGDDTSK